MRIHRAANSPGRIVLLLKQNFFKYRMQRVGNVFNIPSTYVEALVASNRSKRLSFSSSHTNFSQRSRDSLSRLGVETRKYHGALGEVNVTWLRIAPVWTECIITEETESIYLMPRIRNHLINSTCNVGGIAGKVHLKFFKGVNVFLKVLLMFSFRLKT